MFSTDESDGTTPPWSIQPGDSLVKRQKKTGQTSQFLSEGEIVKIFLLEKPHILSIKNQVT
jgi:hypothetical protein